MDQLLHDADEAVLPRRHVSHDGQVTALVYGKYGILTPPYADRFYRDLGGGIKEDDICILKTPTELDDPRRHLVTEWKAGVVVANGVILSERDQYVVVPRLRDCPTTVIIDDQCPIVGVAHCSRDALHGVDLHQPDQSVVNNMLNLMLERPNSPHMARMHGWILAGIGAKHFSNEKYPDVVRELRRLWGNDVIPDRGRSTIDLVSLIKKQLGSVGERVEHDGIDTYTDPQFGSLRAQNDGVPGKEKQNVVLVGLLSRW